MLTPLFIITDRTVRLLGQGTFGKVVEAIDTRLQSRVAVKIIRAIPKYRDASKIEIRVLNRLKERDPNNIQYVTFPLSVYLTANSLAFSVNAYTFWSALIIETIFVSLRSSLESVFMTF